MANSQSSSFVPSGNRTAVGDVYGHKVIVGNQNSVRPDEIYAEVDNLNHLTKVVDFGRTLVPGGGGGTTDYNELENLPSINDVELSGNLSPEDLGLYEKPATGIPASDIASGVIPDISGKEDTSNKVTSFQTTPDDTHYPSEKLVKDYVDGICGNIQTILTSI